MFVPLLAAAFARCGHTVLADDMVAIALNLDYGRHAMLYPAYPGVKLWPSATHALGISGSSLSPLFNGCRKQAMRQRTAFPAGPCLVGHVFVLQEGDVLKLTRISGMDAFFTLLRFFPCPGALLDGASLGFQFEQCVDLLDQVQVWRLERPNRFEILETLMSLVERKVA